MTHPSAQRTATLVGGQGYIGRALLPYLSARGWHCRVMPRQHAWPVRGEDLGAIFYCAGLTGDFHARAADTVEAHVGLLARVLQSDRWTSLVYLSSTRLYDALDPTVRATESLALPVSPLNTRHLFDLTKLAGESVCLAMGGGRARVARLSSVYDAGDDSPGFLPGLVRQVRAAGPGAVLHVESSADAERDYIHRDDVLSALELIAGQGQQPIYNVAAGTNTRNDALARWIGEHTGQRLVFDRPPLGHAAATIDIGRMRDEFNWRPASVESRLGPWLGAKDGTS